MGWMSTLIQKLNPAQRDILDNEGDSHYSTSQITSHQEAYKTIEVVNRGTNLVVDSCAGIKIDVWEPISSVVATVENKPRKAKLNTLLNYKPNPYISAFEFKTNVYLDLILHGDAFIYWDGAYLYNIPAEQMELVADSKTFVSHYIYGNTKFEANEIIHLRDNSCESIYRGQSRLSACIQAYNLIHKMQTFNKNYFENNAIPGLVLSTPNILSPNIKERYLREWMRNYNPSSGGRKPMIVDGEFTVTKLGVNTFQELDYAQSMTVQESKVLKALGVPPILLDSGNNANIAPNLKLFYVTTVIPLCERLTTALELFFGYDLRLNLQDVVAMRPELRDQANYFVQLCNAGILKRNEAREELRYDVLDDPKLDLITIPANVAGSAIDPGTGGRPSEGNNQ